MFNIDIMETGNNLPEFKDKPAAPNKPIAINPRLLIVEVWDNGKISLPQYFVPDNQTITIGELTKARDFINLIIANPENFHIVRPRTIYPGSDGIGILGKVFSSHTREKLINGNWNPLCKKCDVVLISDTEKGTGICFDCEKKGILNASNNHLTAEQKELISGSPAHVIEVPQYCQICETAATKKYVNGKVLCGKCFEDEKNQSTEKPKPIKTFPVTHMTQPGLK